MRWLSFLIATVLCLSTLAQEDVEKNWSLGGYVKNLSTLSFADDSTTFDHLVHNRLNFRWFPTDQINVKIELRNRFFWGETLKELPNYGEFIDINNDYVDLSVMDGSGSVLVHSMIDRAYIEWYKGDWEVRFGRQRINWGVNTIWNPNDLFNAYSFFDFDYEERPGSDALRIKKFTGVASSVEIASNVSDDFDEMVIAGMWKWNRWDYDLQLLGGKAQEDLAVGVGWAGNLKQAGWKTELTYFHPYIGDENEMLLVSTAVDYSFESSFYLNGSVLYASGAPENPSSLESVDLVSTDRLTARDLSPFRYATFLQISYNFHPLVTGGIATIYYPSQRDALFLILL